MDWRVLTLMIATLTPVTATTRWSVEMGSEDTGTTLVYVGRYGQAEIVAYLVMIAPYRDFVTLSVSYRDFVTL